MIKTRRNEIYILISLLLLFCEVRAHSSGQEDDSHHGGHHDEVLPHPDFRKIIEEYPNLEISSQVQSEKEKWIQAGNLAYYLTIHSVRTITIPVQMNVIFVGFDGDGNSGFHLDSENLNPWFEHIDHLIPHSIVPVGEEQTTIHRFKTAFSHVEYSIQINIVKLCPLVNTIIEDYLMWNARAEDVAEEAAGHRDVARKDKYYVDAYKLSAIFNHLLHSLDLANQYTLFILNPNSPVEKDQIYGYRTGFSDEEISTLYRNNEFVAPNISVGKDTPDSIPPILSTTKKISSQRVTMKDLVKESENWANVYLQGNYKSAEEVTQVNSKIENCRNSEDEESPDCLYFKAKESIDVVALAKQIVQNGTKREKEYLYRIQNDNSVHENCLVHSWIGHNRFAFIDLTAGPFEWGPTVAAEGVVSFDSFPKVPSRTQPPAAFPNIPLDKELGIPNSQERYNLYKAEASLLDAYWNAHCSNAQIPPPQFCSELRQVIENRKLGNNNIIQGTESEGLDASSKLDDFTSRLGWIISNSIHHLITPSSPLFKISYTERVSFQIFILKNHQDYNSRSYGYFNYESFKYEIAKLKLPTQEFSFNLKEIQMGSDSELSMAFSNSLKAAVIPRLNTQGHFFTEDILYIDSKEIQHYLQSVENADQNNKYEEKWEKRRMMKRIPIFIFSLNTEFPVFVDKYYTSKAMSDMVIAVQSNFHSYPSRMACNKKTLFWDLRNPTKAVLASTALLVGGIVPTHIGYNGAKYSAYQNWLWSIGDSPFSYTSFEHHFSLFHKDIAFRHFIVDAINESVVLVNEGVEILRGEKLNAENLEVSSILEFSSIREIHNQIKILWVEISGATEQLNYNEAISKIDDLMEISFKFKEMAIDAAEKFDVFKCLEDSTNPKIGERNRKFQWLIPIAVAVDIAVLLLLFSYKSRVRKVKIN